MSIPSLPPALTRIGSLGPVEAVYRSSPPSMKSKFISWFVSTLIVGLIGAVGYFGEATFKRNDMELLAVGLQMLGLFGLVIVGGVWFVVLVFTTLVLKGTMAKPQVIAEFRDGIACSGQGPVQAWTWNELREVYSSYFVDSVGDDGLGARFDLVHRNGTRITVNHFIAGWEQLTARVTREIESRIGPELSRAFQSGQPVAFGDALVLEREGVRIEKQLHPWSTIRTYEVERGQLVIKRHKGSAVSLPLRFIPNSELLLKLLRNQPIAKCDHHIAAQLESDSGVAGMSSHATAEVRPATPQYDAAEDAAARMFSDLEANEPPARSDAEYSDGEDEGRTMR